MLFILIIIWAFLIADTVLLRSSVLVDKLLSIRHTTWKNTKSAQSKSWLLWMTWNLSSLNKKSELWKLSIMHMSWNLLTTVLVNLCAKRHNKSFSTAIISLLSLLRTLHFLISLSKSMALHSLRICVLSYSNSFWRVYKPFIFLAIVIEILRVKTYSLTKIST